MVQVTLANCEQKQVMKTSDIVATDHQLAETGNWLWESLDTTVQYL